MAQVNINIRMDEDLKREFTRLCEDLGMTMTTAINIFAKKAIGEWGIPFEVKAKKLTKDDFNKAFESVEYCNKEESKEIIEILNNLTDEDLEIASSHVVEW